MTGRDIENKLRSAFENTVPEVLPSVLERCSEQEGRVITMTENKKRIPIVKIAVIAAAVVILLTVSVTAAAFTGLVGEHEALGAAMTYVAQNAETTEEQDILTSYILAGVTEVEMFEEQQVDLGLKDFRAIYNISFRLGEYSYKVGVDAKTGVVISCEREIDEEWWRERQSEYIRPIEDYGDYLDELKKFRGLIDSNDIKFIAEEYTGLYTIPQGIYDSYGDCTSHDYNYDYWRGIDVEVRRNVYGYETEDFPEDYDKYSTWYFEMIHGGYKYAMYIDSVTGEVLNCEITEVEEYEYESDRHLHEPIEGYIGPYQAWKTFLEETGFNSFSRDWRSFGVNFVPDGRDVFTDDGTITNDYGKDVFFVQVTMKYSAGANLIVAVIDAETGEVLERMNYDESPNALHNQTASTEAPEGMISEAIAKAIALDDSGIDEANTREFKIELDGKVYKLSYQNKSGAVMLYTYEINAENGDIIYSNAEEID